MMAEKQACDRCGSCCMQGGPALHSQDLSLVSTGALAREHLVTVRKGELAYQPLAERAEPVSREFLKIQGQGGSWCCMFYDAAARACTIYERRPVACGLLDCTSPEALLGIAGKDLLTRFDCIGNDDPLFALVHQHEEECPCPDMATVAVELDAVTTTRSTMLGELTLLVNADLAFRQQVGREQNLGVAMELFSFGRPLFQLLLPLGVRVQESPAGLELF